MAAGTVTAACSKLGTIFCHMMEHPGFSSVTMSHHHGGGYAPGGGGGQQIGGLAPQLHGGLPPQWWCLSSSLEHEHGGG